MRQVQTSVLPGVQSLGVLIALLSLRHHLRQSADGARQDHHGLGARSDPHHAVVGDHACQCPGDRLSLADVQVGTESRRTSDQRQVGDVPP
jgi:hypothetical protein